MSSSSAPLLLRKTYNAKIKIFNLLKIQKESKFERQKINQNNAKT